MESALTNAAAALVAHRDQVALLEQERDVALTELESLRVQQTEGSVRLAELTAESAAVKEHAKAQLQKAIEKIKALTANADSKGQEAARLQENEVRLTEEISGLKENEVRLAEEISGLKESEVRLTDEISVLKEKEVRLTDEIRLLRENEVRLASSSGEVAAALQVRLTELEQSEGRLTQELAEVRATVSESQDRIASQQGNLTACSTLTVIADTTASIDSFMV